jgi:hypothetical protein
MHFLQKAFDKSLLVLRAVMINDGEIVRIIEG